MLARFLSLANFSVTTEFGSASQFPDFRDGSGTQPRGWSFRRSIHVFFNKLYIENTANFNLLVELYHFTDQKTFHKKSPSISLREIVSGTALSLDDFKHMVIPPIKRLQYNYTTIFIKIQVLQKNNINITKILHLIK